MSRLGQIPIKIPSKVECSLKDGRIFVKGEKGVLESPIPDGFRVNIGTDALKVDFIKSSELDGKSSALYGTLCRTVSNMILGVSAGFEKKLELVGVGYKADLQQGKVLKLSLGYSHDIFYSLPEGISVVMEKPTLFKILGICKQKVGQVAAEIIRFRPPEPYKGKGVRIPGQFLRMKEGKTK